jgi:ATP-dependent helicase/DNAse subunit B
MHLLAGPPGSGKTSAVLDAVRLAIRGGRTDIRLLVPTATMAEHLEHRLARDGFIFRRRIIQTLSGFVAGVTPELRQASPTTLYLIVERVARRIRRAEFERVVGMAGFHAAAARVIEEFSSAGCDSARLAGSLPDAPLAEAFLELYRATEQELERRGLVLRARRIQMAAARIEARGADGVSAIWLDGFHALPDPELRLIAALARHAEVMLASEDEDVARYFEPVVVERAARPRPGPAVAVVRAPSIERECDDIARRILEQAAAGRPFREIGIIVRAADAYVPILRASLERFGIPARFYFDGRLERHPAVRLMAGAVDALLGGWDHETVLAVLRLMPRFADFNALDRLDFAARERIPDAGLATLAALTESAPLRRALDELGALEEWRGLVLPPREWAARLSGLGRLFRPSVIEQPGHERALEYRGQAEALDAFEGALGEAAETLEEEAIPLADFWRAAKSALRLAPLRVPDNRRNVVQVLSAPEARQWVVPVVFVCGMVEKQFPQFHRQDPFFSDGARARLNAAGVRVRTGAQFERDERRLFESAVTRATILTTLSYPEFDDRGERNLPSLFLESFTAPAEATRAVRPEPLHPTLEICRRPAHDAQIEAPRLIGFLRQRTSTLSPTALETYLACPFQYFATRMLRLKTAPLLPAERLDFLTQGNIVHEVLAGWWREGGDIAERFESVFARYVEEKRIRAASYQTERLRHGLLVDLLQFASADIWPRDGYESHTEEPFEFELAPGLVIRGKIDRLDVKDGSAYVVDYKYSSTQRVKERREDQNLLQAPLYLMAAEKSFHLRPAGVFYAGVKGELRYVGWSDSGPVESEPIPEDWFGRTTARTLVAVEEIRGGRVEPAPVDRARCRHCDARDVCRYEVGQAAAIGEGA